ncbi:MAG: pteridine-dependent deoxygenase [Xanthomonadales bacterium]|nr:pteridine-dependent deoxygenase [Xanthomonadales bacterium]
MSGKTALQVDYVSGPDVHQALEGDHVLAVFSFGKSPLDAIEPRHVPIALPLLDHDPVMEIWTAKGPIESGQLNHVRFARGLDLSMGHIALDLRDFPDVTTASRVAYAELQEFLGRSPHHWPLKIWNFLPGINVGEGDQERYRQFCVGRALALAEGYGDEPPMPAATAIGSPADEPALQVYFLAGALPGLNVENPRQVNAWRYPRRYSPRSPLFSRGTIMRIGDASQFLISGTASVVGHETQHDNAHDQVAESVRNVHSLLDEGQRLLGGIRPQLGDSGVMRVYVRHASDLGAVRESLADSLPDTLPRLYLNGDICRADLLAEVDGIVTCQ